MSTLEIRPVLFMSTAHVSRETGTWLDAQGEAAADRWSEQGGHLVGATQYGWLVNNTAAEAMPEDLATVMAFAKSQDCDYVVFDRDADLIDALPTFDW